GAGNGAPASSDGTGEVHARVLAAFAALAVAHPVPAHHPAAACGDALPRRTAFTVVELAAASVHAAGDDGTARVVGNALPAAAVHAAIGVLRHHARLGQRPRIRALARAADGLAGRLGATAAQRVRTHALARRHRVAARRAVCQVTRLLL